MPLETWNTNLIKSLPLTIRSQVEVNAAFFIFFKPFDVSNLYNHPVLFEFNSICFSFYPKMYFSLDDLSLPDPLSTPFHTARIYQSSIPG